MREKQLIQLLQFILAWILLWLFVVFIKEESFIDFILRYRLYLLIVSISYFYYYSIQYEPDKKYKLIRDVIIYGNAYLFLHIFFRPLLNISHQLFVLLWLIFLGLWRSSKLQTRRKYLLQFLGWVFSFFILISGMFYFYPEAPDIKWFIESKTSNILFLWVDKQIEKKEAYIQLTSTKDTTDINIIPHFSRELTENQKISYPSTQTQRDEKIIIETPYGDLIQIFPQSEIRIEFDWKNLTKISKLNWKIWFLSWVFDSNIEVIWYEENLTQEQIESLEWIQNSYKYELIRHLKAQISESNIWWANNTIMYNIDGKIIWFLAKMFPVTFGKNLDNYNEFQKYFSRFEEETDLSKYYINESEWLWNGKTSVRWVIKDNINVWKNNTYGRLKKPEKR